MNAILLLAALGVGQPPQGPLTCPHPVAARGDVKAGPPLAHTFELAHAGRQGTVTVTGVTAGCGCLRQTLSTGVLQPGEAAKLTLEVNTLTQPDGPNRWPVRVAYTWDVPPPPGMPPAAPQTGVLLLEITA